MASLYYPTYYEGQEIDKSVIYTSQEATQSVIAAIEWMGKQQCKTFFLVGSDCSYLRIYNRIAKPTITRIGGSVIGEECVPLGHTEFSSIINKIMSAKPNWIHSTVVGCSNVAFYKQLKAAGLDGRKQKLHSTVVSENEIDGICRENAVGYYACMGHFQSLQNPENERFVNAITVKYCADRVVGDPTECAYDAVYLWKLAAKRPSSSRSTGSSRRPSAWSSAPEGRIRVMPNHHVAKKVRVGRARADGQFDIV